MVLTLCLTPLLTRSTDRPLPPLFNWLPGELDSVSQEVQASLQPGRSPPPAPGATTSA